MSTPLGLDELVSRQIRRWEFERNAQAPRPAPPCIALSRLPRSGGAAVGQQVADKLDYGFFGIEIVERIARERGIQQDLVKGLDERVRSVIDRYVVDSFNVRSASLTESEYLRHLVTTLATLGEQGRAVILGRGAPFILSPDRTLRVLVVAHTELRLERAMRETGLERDAALELLRNEDSERRHFLGHHFGVTPDDPTLYDLVVNTGTLGIDGAATAIVDSVSLRFAP